MVRRALGTFPEAPSEPDGKAAAVALLLAPGGAGLETLFIRRAVRAGDPWSGQVALPGGRREAVDRDLTATVVRETREEVDVDLRHAERIAALTDLNPRTPVLPPIVVRPFVFALPGRPHPRPSSEVQSAFWSPLSDLLAPGVRREINLPIIGATRTGPAYVLGADTIWGMTERILTTFFEALINKFA